MSSLLVAVLSFVTLTNAQIFTLTTFNPNGLLHNQKIQASGQAFYLGLDAPTTYCPTLVDPNCPNATDTIVAGALSAMWVEVPGGQQTFVRSEGSIGYTQAHSASVPTGAYRGRFVNVTISSDCEANADVFTWKAPDGSTEGVFACPDVPSYMEDIATYQIFVKTPKFNLTDCIELEGLKTTILPEPAPFGAWQYV
ncbi:hypothetical protein ONS95_011723 [Cadophora gregata]|uniref:uncharacterized protein n=1 Tax=Cadophora gregata TaxID=51156 RepID=UPI0026DB89FF|nr:uncharacterized protein ONS95_011723 [Cadophora gregata]KAK0120317.1 hypothetical protein ONS95_011723 [Cadophora gregata]KAK0121349.1 hypothetical protein ONS96_011524 [Cadophora gregata f. sp. sojae]